jgi:hypothetical protein
MSKILRTLGLIATGYALCAYFQSQVDCRHTYVYQCGSYATQSTWALTVTPFHPAPPVSLFGN